MKLTRITFHSEYPIGTVDPRVFGGFLEHMGRSIYEGVYDPQSKHASVDGFRNDVLDALKPLRMTAMRYPGGNFVSGYHWLDGVGPKAKRPIVRDLAWQSIETNQVGTDEYMKLVKMMGWEPMLTVNLGTGTPEEARNWVEYCNGAAGTRFSNMRVENGQPDPYGVKLWCLGNEMDGPWQLGHVPADQYAIRAQQAAKLMRDVDPSIELVACGTCAPDLPTYMEWDRTVLEYLGSYTDYISLHRYVGNPEGDTANFLAVTNSIDQQIEEMDAACRYVQARGRKNKRHLLCFDEWNVWYRARGPEYENGRGKFAPHLIEEEYNLEDVLVVAGFLNSFIRHADVLKIANLAQVVNVIAPIHTEGDRLLLHSIYYPFLMYSQRREGVALRPAVNGPGYESKQYGYVNYIDTSAILGEGMLNVFASNRSLNESAPVEIILADGSLESVLSADIVTGSAPSVVNTLESPQEVNLQKLESVHIEDGKGSVSLPPLSVAAITFRLKA